MRVETANWRCDGGELWKFYEIGIIDVPQVLFTERGNRHSFGVFDTENCRRTHAFTQILRWLLNRIPSQWIIRDLSSISKIRYPTRTSSGHPLPASTADTAIMPQTIKFIVTSALDWHLKKSTKANSMRSQSSNNTDQPMSLSTDNQMENYRFSVSTRWIQRENRQR